MEQAQLSIADALAWYGNDLARLVAGREGILTETDPAHARARISDLVNYPIDALVGTVWDTGHLWYDMYKGGGVLDAFWQWAEEAGATGSFREAVELAWEVLGAGPWSGRFSRHTPRTLDDVYVAVVAMAVSWSFTDVLDALEPADEDGE